MYMEKKYIVLYVFVVILNFHLTFSFSLIHVKVILA